MLIASTPTTQFRMEIGKVADDPMSDPNLTMQLDVDVTKAAPNGTLMISTLAGTEPDVNVLTARDDEMTRGIYAALRDAVAGVDFLQHGTPADGSPIAPATLRWTATGADGVARSITIDENTQSFAGAEALVEAANQYSMLAFGIMDD